MAVVGDIGLDLTPEGRAAMERLNELADVTIEVGYQADQKAADDETSLAEVAYWNHYGTLHKDGSVMIPARPFMNILQARLQAGTFRLNAVVQVLAPPLMPAKTLAQCAMWAARSPERCILQTARYIM